jgi:hypothetical protein
VTYASAPNEKSSATAEQKTSDCQPTGTAAVGWSDLLGHMVENEIDWDDEGMHWYFPYNNKTSAINELTEFLKLGKNQWGRNFDIDVCIEPTKAGKRQNT